MSTNRLLFYLDDFNRQYLTRPQDRRRTLKILADFLVTAGLIGIFALILLMSS
jgi:predicted phage gp36 major capsid-like protein